MSCRPRRSEGSPPTPPRRAAPTLRLAPSPSAHLAEALHRACRAGHLSVAISAVRTAQGALAGELPEAARCAAANGRLEVLKWLRDAGAIDRALAHGADGGNFRAGDNYSDRADLFTAACRAGHADVAHWLVMIYGTPPDGAGFRAACTAGRLPLARELWMQCGARFAPPIAATSALASACARGNLEVARWLAAAVAGARLLPAAAYRSACAAGRLDVLAWLLGELPPAADDRHTRAVILCYASATDDVSFAQQAAALCGATAADARARGVAPGGVPYRGALRHACRAGAPDVARWLVDAYTLTRADAMPAAFNAACASGDELTLRWFHEAFAPTPAEVRASDGRAFALLCAADNLDAVREFAERYEIVAADARAGGDAAAYCADARCCRAVLCWLRLKYGVQSIDVLAADLSRLKGELPDLLVEEDELSE